MTFGSIDRLVGTDRCYIIFIGQRSEKIELRSDPELIVK
jgi:hypothetical protein